MAQVETPKPSEKKLPQSWIKAAGILRNKKIDPMQYQREIRRGWEVRLRKLEQLKRPVHSKS